MKNNNKSFYKSLKDGEVKKSIALLEKIAKNSSEESFNNFIKSGELPAVKLSKEEMDLISGGWVIKFLGGIANVLGNVLDPVEARMGSGRKFERDECGNTKDLGFI